MLDPKAKPKEEEPPVIKDLGTIRPKTTDNGKRKISLLRRFNGNLIGASNNNMDMINNVFIHGGGQDVISLSIYNNASNYNKSGYSQSASVLPNAKLRPQSAPFQFASDAFEFKKSIRRDKREEIAEIDSLKTRLTKDDIPFKVETIKKAFELPAENEFEGRKYVSISILLFVFKSKKFLIYLVSIG